jgi:hypothetical protein
VGQENDKIVSNDDRSFIDGQNEEKGYMRILETENRNIGEVTAES